MSRAFHSTCYLAALAILVLLPAVGCGGESRTTDPAAAFLGFWRTSEHGQWAIHLVLITRRLDGQYDLDAPPDFIHVPLTLQGGRLVYQSYHNGKETDREVFSLTEGNSAIEWSTYFSPPYTKPPDAVQSIRRASGPPTQLATELAHWQANLTIIDDVDGLAGTVEQWRADHGRNGLGQFPPRSALLPNGSFWRWAHSAHLLVHLTNPISGGPMIMGKGAGNFDYETNSTRNQFTISGHLFGGGEEKHSVWVAISQTHG